MFELILALMIGLGTAQVSADLSGVVFDPSGSAIESAYVQLVDVETGSSSTAITDLEGKYRFLNLSPGRYRILVSAPGFKEYEKQDIKLQAGASQSLTVRLTIAGLTDEITVTATREEGYPHTEGEHVSEVLEIHEVRESSAKDVGEALTRLEGVHKIRKSGIANDIVLRGFQQDNVNVAIDGSHIYGACPNNMDPPAFHVDFAEVEKVEVIKGPFDMRSHGSLGGTVNIINKQAEDGFHVTPNLSAGSYGYFNPSLTASLSKGRFRGLAGHSFRRSDPFEDGLGKRITEYTNYRADALDKEAFHVHTGWFKLGGDLTTNQKLELGYTRQQGGEVIYPYLQMDALYDKADRMNLAWSVNNPMARVDRLKVQGYFTQVKHWMTDEYRMSSVGAARPYGMATYAGTRSLGTHVDAEMGSLFAGAELYVRDWNAITTLKSPAGYTHQASMPDVRMVVAGFYAEHIRQLHPSLRLTVGGRLDTGSTNANSPNTNTDLYFAYKGTRTTSRNDTLPSGSVRLAYAVNNFEIFAGVGHAVRLPDPQERFFALKRMGTDWVGDPNNDPTRNTEVDLGFTARTNRFIVRPTLFYSSLDNFIVIHNQKKLNTVASVMNLTARSFYPADATIYGGELMTSATLTDYLIVRSGLSYTRGSKDLAPERMILDPDLAEIAPVRFRAMLRYGQRTFFGELEGVFVGRQERVDSDLRESPTPGYGVLNAKFGIHREKLKISAGVDNLFDRFYYEHFSYQRDPFRIGTRTPEPGRSAFITMGYAF